MTRIYRFSLVGLLFVIVALTVLGFDLFFHARAVFDASQSILKAKGEIQLRDTLTGNVRRITKTSELPKFGLYSIAGVSFGIDSELNAEVWNSVIRQRYLELLAINVDKAPDVAVSQISSLTNLRMLALRGEMASEAIGVIRSLSKLEELSLDRVVYNDEFSALLKNHRTIKQLNLYGTDLSDELAEDVSTMPELQGMQLFRVRKLEHFKLSSLKNLRVLELVDSDASSETWKDICEIESLRELFLDITSIKSLGNATPRKMEGLNRIRLVSYRFILLEDIQSLKDCPSLNRIEWIAFAGISTEALSLLSELESQGISVKRLGALQEN